MILNRNLLLQVLILIPLFGFSQTENSNLSPVILANFEFGYNMPGGDYANRFGNNLAAGGGVEYLTKKNNFLYGLHGTYYFGNEVKEDVLSNIRNNDGFLIGTNKINASVYLRQRAFYIGGSFGKIFSLNQYNPRAGIRASLGAGFFQQKIRIQEDPNSFVPIIANDYKQGWDRMSNGLGLRQFIGYQQLSLNGLVNFLIGFEFMQAFTQNRRPNDFKTMSKLDESRVELMYGVKIAWTLPFKIGVNADTIYY